MSKKNNKNENENKQQDLVKGALKEITKKFGDEAIMLFGEDKIDEKIETFPTGSYLLDKATGIGGYPKGRIVEIYGPESSGKTTLCLHAIAEVQKLGGVAAFIDAEHSIDPNYARNLGVNLNTLILSQPDSGEQAMEIVDILAKSGAIDLIVVDSVAALVPIAELQGEMKDMQVGTQARLMSKALRKITGSLNKNKTTIIFVNQIRKKIGVMFGNPETTSGGRALKFYSSLRIEVRKSTSITDGKEITGNEIRVKVVKNKLAAPYKNFVTEIMFSKGIDATNELIELAIEKGVFVRKGAWYSYENENIAQGKKALKEFLESNPEFKKEIENKVL